VSHVDELPGAFDRLRQLVYSDHYNPTGAPRRRGARATPESTSPPVELVLKVEPGSMSLSLDVKNDKRTFISGVAVHTAQLESGANATLDGLATELLADLAGYALEKGPEEES
jgi:hypothetical protein